MRGTGRSRAPGSQAGASPTLGRTRSGARSPRSQPRRNESPAARMGVRRRSRVGVVGVPQGLVAHVPGRRTRDRSVVEADGSELYLRRTARRAGGARGRSERASPQARSRILGRLRIRRLALEERALVVLRAFLHGRPRCRGPQRWASVALRLFADQRWDWRLVPERTLALREFVCDDRLKLGFNGIAEAPG